MVLTGMSQELAELALSLIRRRGTCTPSSTCWQPPGKAVKPLRRNHEEEGKALAWCDADRLPLLPPGLASPAST